MYAIYSGHTGKHDASDASSSAPLCCATSPRGSTSPLIRCLFIVALTCYSDTSAGVLTRVLFVTVCKCFDLKLFTVME